MSFGYLKNAEKMLRYTEFGMSHREVPGESNLCIYISGCQNNCKNCHYPELKSPYEGEILSVYFEAIIGLYEPLSTCVCFMGEGDLTEQSRNELVTYARYIKSKGLKSCLYSGRDVYIEDWMYIFDYVKTGRYIEEAGSLYEKTTNQRLYHLVDKKIIDITDRFWK